LFVEALNETVLIHILYVVLAVNPVKFTAHQAEFVNAVYEGTTDIRFNVIAFSQDVMPSESAQATFQEILVVVVVKPVYVTVAGESCTAVMALVEVCA